MTKKGKIVFLLVLIIAILLKEEVYGILFKATLTSKTEEMICEVKNENLEEKYQELSSAYNYKDSIPYHLEHSKILYRDLYDLKKQITIYKGEKDNIKEKNLVINEQGLIGIVSKVNKNSSEVDLLTKDNLNLSVKINDNYGILKKEKEELVIKGINNKGEVKVGDKIYTSDLSIYPENILVGKVKEVKFDTYEIEKIIKVEAGVNFEAIKYVSVITDLRGEE